MKCWNCGSDVQLTTQKIPFRAICDHCSFYLHCCKNCRYYKPGLPNDCAVPGTDYIADRTTNNFCEEFVLKLEDHPQMKNSKNDVEERLFGQRSDDQEPDFPKDRFDFLFR